MLRWGRLEWGRVGHGGRSHVGLQLLGGGGDRRSAEIRLNRGKLIFIAQRIVYSAEHLEFCLRGRLHLVPQPCLDLLRSDAVFGLERRHHSLNTLGHRGAPLGNPNHLLARSQCHSKHLLRGHCLDARALAPAASVCRDLIDVSRVSQHSVGVASAVVLLGANMLRDERLTPACIGLQIPRERLHGRLADPLFDFNGTVVDVSAVFGGHARQVNARPLNVRGIF